MGDDRHLRVGVEDVLSPDGQRRSLSEGEAQLQVDDRPAVEEALFQPAGRIEDRPASAVVVLTAIQCPLAFKAV